MLSQALQLFGIFSLLFVGFFSSVIWQNKLLAPGDAAIYSVPAFATWPILWTNLLGCGVPLGADPQYQMWNPLRIFCMLFLDYNFLVIAGYSIAATCAFCFLFSLTRSKLGAAIGALAYAMSGFMVAHLGHITIVQAAAWLPLLLLAIEQSKLVFKWYWLVIGELAVAFCLLGGHSQVLLMQLIVSTFFAFRVAWQRRYRFWQILATYSFMVLLGLGLVALQLLPTLELASFSMRNDWSFDQFVSFSLPPRQLVQLIIPFFFFKPVGYELGVYGRSTYGGDWCLTELAGYVGLIPLIFALVALFKAPREKWFWFSLAMVALVLAAGQNTPLAKLLFHVPILNHFRCPARWLLVFDLAISVLAAFGVAALQRSISFRERIALTGLSFASLICLATVSVFWSLKFLRRHFHELGIGKVELSPVANAHMGLPILILLLGLLVLAGWIWKRENKYACTLLLLATFIDLSSFAYFCEWRWYAPAKSVFSKPQIVQSLLQAEPLEPLGDHSQFRIVAPLADLGGLSCCPPNLNSLWGLPSAAYYSPLCTARMSQLFEDFGSARFQNDCRLNDIALDVAAVKYLIVPKNVTIKSGVECDISKNFLPFDEEKYSGHHFQISKIVDTTNAIYNNLHYLPRFRLVNKVIPLKDPECLTVIHTSRFADGNSFCPAGTAIIDLDDREIDSYQKLYPSVFDPEHEEHKQKIDYPQSSLVVEEDQPDAIKLSVKTDLPALISIADQFYPGWTCLLDGAPTKIFRTNCVFQGVFLPAGLHRVELQYKSKSFEIGLDLSICIVLANVLLAAYSIRKSLRN